MRAILFLLAISAIPCAGQTSTQTYVFDAQGNMIAGTHIKSRPGTEIILKDSNTSNRFVLDSLHIHVYGLNSQGDTIWATDPWKDNKLMEYRVKRPVIVQFSLQKNKWTKNREVIWIVYNNTQFGIIEKDTGKFNWFGQD